MMDKKTQTGGDMKAGKLIRTANVARALSTVAVVVVPVAAATAAIVGYGVHTILKKLRKTGP